MFTEWNISTLRRMVKKATTGEWAGFIVLNTSGRQSFEDRQLKHLLKHASGKSDVNDFSYS